MKKIMAPLLLVALLLTGCGGVKADATYENVSDLREAVLASDGECPGETPDGDPEEGEVLIVCGNDTVLRWFPNEDELVVGKVALNVGLLDADAYLTGPNWIVQGDANDLAEMQDALGGELTAL